MSIFKAERDTIAGLGLLASHFIRFDPAIPVAGKMLHSHGFNVHCLVIDNVDGEVLALNRNRIYADHNPLQHAEQVAVRDAMARLHVKRPRPDGMTIDDYIRRNMFMAPGTNDADYTDVGCTLYNTFDPCGFCAVTLLVCYMKRIAYIFEDKKFDGVYERMREYFKNRESVKEPLALIAEAATPLGRGARLIAELRVKVNELVAAGTQLVMTLDSQREALEKGAELFASITSAHLATQGTDRDRNLRTLNDIRRLCNIT